MNLLAIDWSANPAIFSWPLEVRWYGLFWAMSFLLGYQIVAKTFKQESIDEKKMEKLLLFGLIAAVLGARLGHVFFYSSYDDLWGEGGYLSNPLQILNLRGGGLASHGGVIGMLLGMWLYRKKVLPERSYLWLVDRVALAAALSTIFIRVGNLFNHEIVGLKTDGFGFKFLRSSSSLGGVHPQTACEKTGLEYIDENVSHAYSLIAENAGGKYDAIWASIPVRHPVQLYEAISYLVIFAIVMFFFFKKDMRRFVGFTFGLFFTLLFTARFFLEYFKVVQHHSFGDEPFLRMGQWLSIPCIVAGMVIMVWASKRKPDSVVLSK